MKIGLVTFIQYPGQEDPKIEELELFDNIDDTIARSEELMQEFIEEYDLDYCEHAYPMSMKLNKTVFKMLTRLNLGLPKFHGLASGFMCCLIPISSMIWSNVSTGSQISKISKISLDRIVRLLANNQR